MKAAPSSCRVSMKRMSLRPCISVTILLVVEPTTPKVYSTPSARNASRTAWPAFICVSSLGLVSHSPHQRWHEMLDRRSADLLHDGARLDAQQFERTLDAWLPEGAEAPDVRAAHAHRGRSHAQRLDDVGAAAEPRVDQDRDAALHRFDDFRERIDGRAPAIFAARAVVGNDDPVHTCISGEHGVLVGENALEHDLHLGRVA